MTFDDKLAAIERDLGSIVTRMNKDRSHTAATKAQVALSAVANLRLELEFAQLHELDWKWKPGP